MYSENDLVTAQQIMTELGIKATSFWNLRQSGGFPAPVINISQKLRRWSRADFDAFKRGEWKKSPAAGSNA